MTSRSLMVFLFILSLGVGVTACGSGASAPIRPDLSPGDADAQRAVTIARADLERLPGSYAQEEMGLAVKIDLQGDRVRLTILEGPPFPPALLIPTSPTRFRWEGEGLAPGLAVVFDESEGTAPGLTIIQPGKPLVVMKRLE